MHNICLPLMSNGHEKKIVEDTNFDRTRQADIRELTCQPGEPPSEEELKTLNPEKHLQQECPESSEKTKHLIQ